MDSTLTKREAFGVAQELAPGRRIVLREKYGYCHVVASLAGHHYIGSGPDWKSACEALSRQISPLKVEKVQAQNGKTLRWKLKTAWKTVKGSVKDALRVLKP